MESRFSKSHALEVYVLSFFLKEFNDLWDEGKQWKENDYADALKIAKSVG
jgi:hypothetical protein